MLGLWQTAALYRREGVRGGKPVYAEAGVPFPCRAEIARGASPGGQRVAGRVAVKLFAGEIDVSPGDKVALPGGGAAIVTEVKVCPGPDGVHHLEMLAEGADGRG